MKRIKHLSLILSLLLPIGCTQVGGGVGDTDPAALSGLSRYLYDELKKVIQTPDPDNPDQDLAISFAPGTGDPFSRTPVIGDRIGLNVVPAQANITAALQIARDRVEEGTCLPVDPNDPDPFSAARLTIDELEALTPGSDSDDFYNFPIDTYVDWGEDGPLQDAVSTQSLNEPFQAVYAVTPEWVPFPSSDDPSHTVRAAVRFVLRIPDDLRCNDDPLQDIQITAGLSTQIPGVALPIPAALVLFQHHDFAGRPLVIIPAGSPGGLRGPRDLADNAIARVVGPLRDAKDTLETLGDTAMFVEALTPLSALETALNSAPCFEIVNRINDLNDLELVYRGPLENDDEWPDTASSFILLGFNSSVRLANNVGLSDDDGLLRARTGSIPVLSVGNLAHKHFDGDSVREPGRANIFGDGAIDVLAPPDGDFGDNMESVEFEGLTGGTTEHGHCWDDSWP